MCVWVYICVCTRGCNLLRVPVVCAIVWGRGAVVAQLRIQEKATQERQDALTAKRMCGMSVWDVSALESHKVDKPGRLWGHLISL